MQTQSPVFMGLYSMNKITILSILVILFACTDSGYIASDTSNKILSQLEANNFESIDFSSFAGKEWTKVCFLGPYNVNSEKALGFSWHVSEYTDALNSDGHNVIVFSTDSTVIEYVVHARSRGDFWTLSGQCLPRDKALLIRDKDSRNGRNYVFKKHNK